MIRSPDRRLWTSFRLPWALGLVLVVAGLVLGCGRGSFVGRQYDDFTAYYNTYHNATKAFEKGLKSVNQSKSDIDRARYISVFPEVQASSGQSSFEKAIQKSAEVLREHPNSKWVDDALLLIGRSRYYQQNYVGAAQKFREVIALEGEREGEARFRLVQTLLAADRYPEAAEALRAALNTEANYGPWTARMQLARGQLQIRREEWQEAKQALTRGLDDPEGLPDEAKARGAFLLGQVHETLENFDEAQAAYRQADEHSPSYQLEFASRLAAIEMEGRSGDPEGALGRLESLEREDDTNEMRGRIARVRAQLYKKQGRSEKAKGVLTAALRGDKAPSGTVQGRLHYDLATLYRDTFEDFTQAAAHFDTASTTLSSRSDQGGVNSDQQTRVLPRTPTDAAAQAERFGGLADQSRAVARMDSLLRLGRMPPSEFEAAVERLRQQRLEAQEQEAQARRERQQQFRAGGQARSRDGQSSSQANAVQTRGNDAGFLFHRDPTLVQQGRRQFQQTWGDRPLVDNWRRVNAIRGGDAPSTADEGGTRTDGASGGQGSSASVVDLSAVPRDSASQAEMEKNRVVARYELGKALLRAAGRPDSAETWFRRVLKGHEGHPVIPKALYGLAQAHRAQGDSAAATQAYRRLVEEHSGTSYATQARKQLGLERAEPGAGSEASAADSAYAQAYDTWQNGAPDAALGKLLAVARTYPERSVAPRALLAAGVLYHRSAPPDSSGRLQAQFKRHVDSLAQSSDELSTGAEAHADTVDGAQPTPPPHKRTQSDTTDGRSPSRRATDPTAASDTSARGGRPPEPVPDTTEARPDSSTRTAPDPSSPEEEDAQDLPRRVVDSTTAAERDPRARRPDSMRADSSASPPDTTIRSAQDTTTRSAQDTMTTRRGTDREAGADSTRADSSDAGLAGPLEVLFTYLTEEYAGTPEAKRAQKLLAYLEQQRTAPESAAPDSQENRTSPGKGAPSDTAAVSTAPDSVAVPEERPQRPAVSADSSARSRQDLPSPSRSREDPSTPAQQRDPTAAPARDSTTAPQESPAPPAPPDSSGEG